MWAILATLCCCVPTGIVAIVYAARVDNKRSSGDLQGAIEDACRGLDVPVLLVSGGRSDLVTDRTVGHFLELAPHARHVQLPQATHMVAGDDNSAFTDTLLHFLHEHLPHDLPAPTAAHGDPR